MATETACDTDVLTDVGRECARGEARSLTAMLDYRDREMARTATIDSPMLRLTERGAIPMAIGEAMGLSEGQVQMRLSFADTVRDQSPTSWEAFVDGRIDLARVRDIGRTIEQLKRAESVHRLDQRVIDYAATHTAAELRAWLKQFVRRVEADLATERADEERDKRHVSITHGDDSMSLLNLYAPSHEVAAVAERFRKGARRHVDPDDTRTVAQREADLVIAWCLDSDATSSVIEANIAVTIDADVLAGAVAGFAESTDGTWAVPAWWMTDVIATGSTFWHRIVTEPVTGDVLSHEYLGRFAPDILDIALQFLHGVCTCMADGDHRPSAARQAPGRSPAATESLRRRGTSRAPHGILKWSTLKTNSPPPLVIEIYTEPVDIEYDAA